MNCQNKNKCTGIYLKILTIFLLAIFVSNANAESYKRFNQKQNSQKVSVYFHPMFLIGGVIMDNIDLLPCEESENCYKSEESNPPLFIYLTIEVPQNLSNSLIIQPSLWFGESDNFRVGSGVGIRHFTDTWGKNEGLYLQAMGSFYGYNYSEEIWDKVEHKKGFYGDLLGYVGYAIKKNRFSMFLDAGIGVLFPNPDIEIPALGDHLLFDFNFGIGFSI